MRKERAGVRILDWGKGPASSIWASLLIGTILVLNTVAIVISLPYIIEGVPKEYSSSLEGTIYLPYIPVDEADVSFEGPGMVSTGDPFTLTYSFNDGRLPSIPYEVFFKGPNSTWTFGLFPAEDPVRGLELVARVPGIPEQGDLDIYIRPLIPGKIYQKEWPDTDDHTDGPAPFGPWPIRVVKSTDPHPIPVLYDNLAISSNIPDDRLLFNADPVLDLDITNFHVLTSAGRRTDLVEISEDRWGLEDQDIIDSGISGLTLIRDEGGNRSSTWEYLISSTDGLDENDLEGLITVKRALAGTDQLYNQTDPGPITVDLHSDLELYQNAYYLVRFGSGDTDHQTGPFRVFFQNTSISLPLAVEIGSRTYWVPLIESNIYEGTFRAPSSAGRDDELTFNFNYPGMAGKDLRTGFKIVKDRSPGSEIRPDPFRLENYRNGIPAGLDLVLSAEWADFNRKDFQGAPRVELNGQEVIPQEEEDDFFEQNLTYHFDRSVVCSGGNLSITSNNSLEFANWVSILIPAPRIFFTFPIPITGWGAVIWFILISISCVSAVVWLFYRTIRQTLNSKGGDGKRSFTPSMRWRDNDLAATARTFLGAMFFFYVVYWMFDLFEQPTPGLDILSGENPVWIRMFLLADASVWEEISGRLILIGIPLFIYRSISGGKGPQWKQIIGGTGHFGPAEVGLILLSATLFGVAHLGWGPWKVVPTFVHGLLFGYLFVKIGLHATIAMHFLFDYSDFFFEITGMQGNTVFILLLFTTVLLGGLFLGNWVHRCHSWASRTVRGRAPRPSTMLVLHSILSVLLGILLVTKQGFGPIAILFLLVPIIDAISFKIWKRYRNPLARVAVFFSSFMSWAVSPIGLAWVTDPEFEQD